MYYQKLRVIKILQLTTRSTTELSYATFFRYLPTKFCQKIVVPHSQKGLRGVGHVNLSSNYSRTPLIPHKHNFSSRLLYNVLVARKLVECEHDCCSLRSFRWNAFLTNNYFHGPHVRKLKTHRRKN